MTTQTLDLSGSIPLVNGIPVYPIYGSQQMGTHTSADVVSAQTLVSQLADGLGLDELWEEFETILNFWNSERTSITDLLSFKTVLAGEAVVQNVDSGPFEKASEFGVAVAQGVPLEAAVLGYDRHDWDRRSSFTWKALRDSSSEQIRTVFQAILHADTRLVTGRVLRRLLSPAPTFSIPISPTTFQSRCGRISTRRCSGPPTKSNPNADTTSFLLPKASVSAADWGSSNRRKARSGEKSNASAA